MPRPAGFLPGGISLHGMMSAHGPDAATTERAMAAALAPHKIEGTLAFMFETGRVLRPTEFALACPQLQAVTMPAGTGSGGIFPGDGPDALDPSPQTQGQKEKARLPSPSAVYGAIANLPPCITSTTTPSVEAGVAMVGEA